MLVERPPWLECHGRERGERESERGAAGESHVLCEQGEVSVMKLVRFGPRGHEKPGLVDGAGRIRDLSGETDDIGAATLARASLERLAALDLAALPLAPEGVRLGAPVARPPNFHAIGLNYHDHARETGAKIPTEPVLFNKATSSVSGPYDDIVRPPGAEKLDYEVELAVVIGTEAHFVPESKALEHVAGYMVANDVSERAFQLEGTGQWTKGKSAPTFGPLGPWLVTADEVADPQALALTLEVDGEPRQNGNTRDMIFSVAEIIAYMSRHMVLLPGDVIVTGTPAGVALGMDPPRYLVPGNELRLAISGLGEQRAKVVAAEGRTKS